MKADVAGSTTWWGQIPIMVAIDKGFFKDAGLDVTLRPIIASSDRMAAVAAGSVVFSNLGRIAVIANMARGDQSFWYFANIDNSPGNEGCWARPGFTSLQQLKGHKVAANTSAEITHGRAVAERGHDREGHPVRQSAARPDGARAQQG